MTEAAGLPLVVKTGPANPRDEKMLLPLLDALPKVPGPHGRPREKPDALLADRGYGFPWTISAVKARGIIPLIAPRGSPHGSGLGKFRYVVERTLSWFTNFRRLRLCFFPPASMLLVKSRGRSCQSSAVQGPPATLTACTLPKALYLYWASTAPLVSRSAWVSAWASY
ncbi:MAG TPA: transposase [Phycisphaerae bacterium]|nr:transposase [Phycisphaerae bacterium]HWB54511.1 transposase [Tepidisphaeraceae bacterium]